MGANVNEATLGTVPSATSATNATNAANAATASNLGGAPASAYTKATDFAYGEMDSNGGVKASPPHKNLALLLAGGIGSLLVVAQTSQDAEIGGGAWALVAVVGWWFPLIAAGY
jgi:hypothetical protein